MDNRSQGPQVPELAGLAEIADILGVSKQRVRELAAQDDAFPQPVAELKGGAIYVKPMIEEFKKHWTRQPGRPTKAQAQVTTELAHIPKVKGNVHQQIFRSTFNSVRRHDLSVDPNTPPGQSLYVALKITERGEGPEQFEPDYRSSVFQPEAPDKRYIERHAACNPPCYPFLTGPAD